MSSSDESEKAKDAELAEANKKILRQASKIIKMKKEMKDLKLQVEMWMAAARDTEAELTEVNEDYDKLAKLIGDNITYDDKKIQINFSRRNEGGRD